jgi:cytidylate kinase
MYRRPKFLDALLEIRREMAREANYEVDEFVKQICAGQNDAAADAARDPHSGQASERSTPVLEGHPQTAR